MWVFTFIIKNAWIYTSIFFMYGGVKIIIDCIN